MAIVLHWAIAALILLNLWYGLSYDQAREAHRASFKILQLHKSVGITILVLSVLRLAWRLTHKPPPYPAHMARWEKLAASSVHVLLYVIMLGMPLTGWVIVSASPTNIPTLLYQHIPWPHLSFIHNLPVDQRKPVADQVALVHHTLAYVTFGLIVLHVGAALKHLILDRDAVLSHMLPLPFLRPRSEAR